jgi:hypothetical protein
MNKTFSHSGARGDIIYGLPTVKALGGGTIYIKMVPTHYRSRPLDERDLLWFRELLVGQDYIEDVKKWEQDVHVDYDLDEFRKYPHGIDLLSVAHLTAFKTSFDLSQPWLSIPGNPEADIIINRSLRYHGIFAWDELYGWEKRCLFVGLKDEYEDFIKVTGLNIQYRGECSYRDLARMIAGSKLFIGNQSFAFSLAEAMKHPRILEVFPIGPNCMPQSPNGLTRLTQAALHHFVEGGPFRQEPSMDFSQPSIGIKMRSSGMKPNPVASYLVCGDIPTGFAEKATRDKAEVIRVDTYYGFRQGMNEAAARSKGNVICVVDAKRNATYSMARKLTDLLAESEGVAGMYIKSEPTPVISGSCFAVSRKAYEQCGLFNLAMLPGRHNLIEIVLRYAGKGYACRTAGIIPLDEPLDSPFDAEKNSAYIQKVYGGIL